MRRGNLAERTGCHPETIRYYEAIGLLAQPARTGGGHRVYSGRDERQLRFILHARELGFTLAEVRELLQVDQYENDQASCGQVQTLLRTHLDSLRAQMARLARLEAELEAAMADCETGGRAACPMLERLHSSRSSAGDGRHPARFNPP